MLRKWLRHLRLRKDERPLPSVKEEVRELEERRDPTRGLPRY